MGLTLDCARCHDHPFDPVTIHDYYSMAGIFRSTNSLVPGNVAGFHERELRDEFVEQRKEFERTLVPLEKKLKEATNLVKSLSGEEFTNHSRSLDPLTMEGIVVDDLEAIERGNGFYLLTLRAMWEADIIMMIIPTKEINLLLTEPRLRKEESMIFRYPIGMARIVRRKFRSRLCMLTVSRKST